jgi:hypothetical protein
MWEVGGNFDQPEVWKGEDRVGIVPTQWELRFPRQTNFRANSGRYAGGQMKWRVLYQADGN